MKMRGTLAGLIERVLAQRELFLYCVIGCSGAALDAVAYSVLVKSFGVHYQFANFISVSIGITNNFFWNYYCNFKSGSRFWQRLASFYCVGMIGWSLSAGCLWLLIEQLRCNAIASKLLTIVLVTVVQFLLNKFITFRKRGA